MELIKITDQRLKIMLTPSDMTQFALDPITIENCNAQTTTAFRLDAIAENVTLSFMDL